MLQRSVDARMSCALRRKKLFALKGGETHGKKESKEGRTKKEGRKEKEEALSFSFKTIR